MNPSPFGANIAIEAMLDARLRAIEASFDADGLAIYAPMEDGLDGVVRNIVEAVRQSSTRDHLVILVDTLGGVLDVVERIVDTTRYHYKNVSFVVPNAAYSAGTILVMSGDAIYMDYYSRLGPIDPQVPDRKGQLVPALGYLKRYEALIEKASKPDGLSIAEIQLLVAGFDQAQLYMYEHARFLSVKLLGDWLCKYKFKDWYKTESGKDVTPEYKRERAEDIADKLNDTERWHSHSKGISATVLWDELKLKIDQFGLHEDAIRQYHELLTDYAGLNEHFGLVHAPGMYTAYHTH